MSRCLRLVAFLLLAAAPAAGQAAVDIEREGAELRRLHCPSRDPHFKTDADALVRNAPEVFVTVSRGRINRSKPEDTRRMFTDYFRGAKYFEWDDLEEPIVHVSRDGSMAWMITRIRVRRVQKDASGAEREEKFVYAGIMTYEKRDGRWTRVANVSTFEPPN
jgi:hypothetical protein